MSIDDPLVELVGVRRYDSYRAYVWYATPFDSLFYFSCDPDASEEQIKEKALSDHRDAILEKLRSRGVFIF